MAMMQRWSLEKQPQVVLSVSLRSNATYVLQIMPLSNREKYE